MGKNDDTTITTTVEQLPQEGASPSPVLGENEQSAESRLRDAQQDAVANHRAEQHVNN